MSSNTDAAVAPVFLTWTGEFALDASLTDAWRIVMDYPSWQNFPTAKHVSGPKGQEGEVVLLQKEEAGFKSPPYFARTVKLDPESRVIWKVYPEGENPPLDFYGIVEFRLFADGARSRFWYNLFYEFQVAYREERELEAFRRQMTESFEPVFASMWEKLRALAAARA